MKLLTLTAVAAATLTACTPHEISVFAALAPHQRDAVADHLNRSADCFTAGALRECVDPLIPGWVAVDGRLERA